MKNKLIFVGIASFLFFIGTALPADEKQAPPQSKPLEEKTQENQPGSLRDHAIPPELANISVPDDDPYLAAMGFVRAMAIIRKTYVDKEKVSYDKLFKSALRGMFQDLDPFSSYESAERFQALNEDGGKFAGIGAALSKRDTFLDVVNVLKNGPAQRAGLRAGDLILEIDGASTAKMDMKKAIDLIRGPKDSVLNLKIYRRSDDTNRDLSIKRAFITISSVTGIRMLSDHIGYLRITQFTASTPADLEKGLDMLKKQGMKALVLDVRSNPGGLLDSAIQICSKFLKTGVPILSVEGRDTNKTSFTALNCKKTLDIPMAILINGNSASAAELFPACMQDHKRAILVGERSFGKGSVQTVIPFENKTALRITTAKYYTPSRRIIHENGIEPDIKVPLTQSQSHALSTQISNYPGEIKPVIPNAIRDTQLERAIEILKGIQIFQDAKSADTDEQDETANPE